MPLTLEETSDYTVKDSLQIIRKSQKYLDSVDAVGNKPSIASLLFGYTHSNTFKEKYYYFESPLGKTLFNTVQGWHTGAAFGFSKNNEKQGTRFNTNVSFDYGISDKRFRTVGSISYRFNNFSRPFLRVRGGNALVQFNQNNPIPGFRNTISSLFFEENFAKFYSKTFLEANYSQEIVNGIYLFTDLGYEERKPAFNTTNYVIIGSSDTNYTSNNPLDSNDFENGAIDPHNILKFQLNLRFRFGQKYLNYPDGKFNLFNDYPTLYAGYEKGFAGSNAENNFDQLKLRLSHNFAIADKGTLAYNLRAGTFLNADGISFADFQHFNGNQTRVSNGNYLDAFYLLNYYALSTNKNYFEAHIEHNFKGYIMGKIPLLNKLNANLVVSSNFLATGANKPYTEFSVGLDNLGWKKFRFFRVNYAKSNFGGVEEYGWVVGFKLLSLLGN